MRLESAPKSRWGEPDVPEMVTFYDEMEYRLVRDVVRRKLHKLTTSNNMVTREEAIDMINFLYFAPYRLNAGSFITMRTRQVETLATLLFEAASTLPEEQGMLAHSLANDMSVETSAQSINLVIPEALPEDFS